MKKFGTSVLASFILLAFIFSSCSESLGGGDEISSYDSTTFGKYSEFGASIRAGFEDKFGDAASARAVLDAGGEFETTADDENIECLADDENGSDYLFENNYISETAKSYIEKIEKLFDSENDSAIEDGITGIENEAMEKLSGDDLDNVMYYAEAAKGGISYWSEVDNSGARWGIRKFFKKFKHVIVSTAVGAIVGAGVGFAATGTFSGAIAGAVSGGIGSGSAAYKSGKISVSYKYRKNK